MPYATIATNPTIREDWIRMGPRRREPSGSAGIISGSRLEGDRTGGATDCSSVCWQPAVTTSSSLLAEASARGQKAAFVRAASPAQQPPGAARCPLGAPDRSFVR